MFLIFCISFDFISLGVTGNGMTNVELGKVKKQKTNFAVGNMLCSATTTTTLTTTTLTTPTIKTLKTTYKKTTITS